MVTYLATLIALYWKFRQNEIVQTGYTCKTNNSTFYKNFLNLGRKIFNSKRYF